MRGQAAGCVARVVRDDAKAAGTFIARATVWEFFVAEPPTIGSLKIDVFLIIHADGIVLCIPRAGSPGRTITRWLRGFCECGFAFGSAFVQ